MEAVILYDTAPGRFCYGRGNCVQHAHDAFFVIKDVRVDIAPVSSLKSHLVRKRR